MTVLPDGKIAIVGKKRKFVEFKSTTNNKELKLNSEYARIQSIHSLKTQPFIAVLTKDGIVSIYHIGTGQRTRILHSSVGGSIIAFHPSENVFSLYNQGKRLETYWYYEWNVEGKNRGKWRGPNYPNFKVDGQIIAIGFNTEHKEQIMIENNGRITYMKDCSCIFQSQAKVITHFSVENYDFHDVICDEQIREQLRKNGAKI